MIALHDGVGDGGVTDPCMPVFDRQLAGNDRRFAASSVVNDLQQIRARHAVDGAHAQVIEHQHVSLGQLQQSLAEGRAAVPDAQFFLQAGYTLVDCRVSTPAGVLRQRAGQLRLASPCRSGDQLYPTLTHSTWARLITSTRSCQAGPVVPPRPLPGLPASKHSVTLRGGMHHHRYAPYNLYCLYRCVDSGRRCSGVCAQGSTIRPRSWGHYGHNCSSGCRLRGGSGTRNPEGQTSGPTKCCNRCLRMTGCRYCRRSCKRPERGWGELISASLAAMHAILLNSQRTVAVGSDAANAVERCFKRWPVL